MSVGIFDSLAPLRRSLDYHLRRHSLLTSNIANAETPGYRPVDISFKAILQRTEDLRLTNEKHMSESEASEGGFRFTVEPFEDATVIPGNDRNSVSLEREMAKLSANSIRYRATVEMLSRRMALLKYAASEGQ